MRQSNNTLFIEGYLNKKDLEIKQDKENKNYITGTLSIRVSEKNIIPVDVYAKEYTKAGNINRAYIGLMTVKNEFKDATEAGTWEQAEKVRVVKGKISTNEYLKQGEVTTRVKYSTSFINRVRDNFNPQAKYEIEIIVDRIKESPTEENKVRGIIQGYYVDYNEKILPITFVANNSIWTAIENKFKYGDTWSLSGDVVNQIHTEKIVKKADIGEDVIKTERKFINERQILSAIEVDASYSQDEIREGLKAKNLRYQAMLDGEVANKAYEGDVSKEISDDDLPF